MPIATPPAIRQATKAANDPAHPVSTDDSGEEQRRGEQQSLPAEPVAQARR